MQDRFAGRGGIEQFVPAGHGVSQTGTKHQQAIGISQPSR